MIQARTVSWRPIEGRRGRIISGAIALSATMALASTLLFTHPDLSPQLMGPFTAIHGLLISLLLAALAWTGMMGVLVPLSHLFGGMQTIAGLAAGLGMGAILPFAQVSDPGSAASSSGGRAATAAHEIQIGAYGGYNNTRPSLVHMTQANDTDLTLTDVKWLGTSFQIEPYWGVRTTYWNAKMRGLGLMFDYTHGKATADKNQTLNQSGKRDGEVVPSEEPFATTFRKLEFTHGLNFFTLNALYRTRALFPRIAPYVGIGIGLSVPHVDMTRAGWKKETRTYEHQITGLAFQVLGGLELRIASSGRVSAFAEYKFTSTQNEAELTGGGTLDTDLLTHQIPVGFSYHHFLGLR